MTREEGIEFGILWVVLTYVMHEFHYLYVTNNMVTIYEKVLYSTTLLVYFIWTFGLFASYIRILIRKKGGKKNGEKETR